MLSLLLAVFFVVALIALPFVLIRQYVVRALVALLVISTSADAQMSVPPTGPAIFSSGGDGVGATCIEDASSQFAPALPGFPVCSASGSGLGKRPGTGSAAEWSLYTDTIEMARIAGTAGSTTTRNFQFLNSFQMLSDVGSVSRPGIAFGACNSCGFSEANGTTGGGPIAAEVRFSASAVQYATQRNDYGVWATRQRFLSGTAALPGIAFSSDSGSGLGYNTQGFGSTDVLNAGTLVASFGASGAQATMNIITPTDSVGSGGVTRSALFLPGAGGATADAVTAGICNASTLRKRVFIDDTDDAKPACECTCTVDSTDNYVWARLKYGTYTWSEGAVCGPNGDCG